MIDSSVCVRESGGKEINFITLRQKKNQIGSCSPRVQINQTVSKSGITESQETAQRPWTNINYVDEKRTFSTRGVHVRHFQMSPNSKN